VAEIASLVIPFGDNTAHTVLAIVGQTASSSQDQARHQEEPMLTHQPIALTRPRLAALTLLALAVTATAAHQARGTRTPEPMPRGQPETGPPRAAADPARLTTLVPPGRTPHGTGRGPGSHLCPAAGCRRPISPDRLMCRPHWYHVPKPLRDTVWATWRSGTGTGTPAHTSAILAAITAATAPKAATAS